MAEGTSFACTWLISGRGHLPRLVANSGEEESVSGSEANFEEGTRANSEDISVDKGWKRLLFAFFAGAARTKLAKVISCLGGA